MKPKIIRSQMKHKIRHRDGGLVEVVNYVRGKAIKLYCTECMGWESHPKDCNMEDCALFPFRGRMEAAIRAKNGGRVPTDAL